MVRLSVAHSPARQRGNVEGRGRSAMPCPPQVRKPRDLAPASEIRLPLERARPRTGSPGRPAPAVKPWGPDSADSQATQMQARTRWRLRSQPVEGLCERPGGCWSGAEGVAAHLSLGPGSQPSHLGGVDAQQRLGLGSGRGRGGGMGERMVREQQSRLLTSLRAAPLLRYPSGAHTLAARARAPHPSAAQWRRSRRGCRRLVDGIRRPLPASLEGGGAPWCLPGAGSHHASQPSPTWSAPRLVALFFLLIQCFARQRGGAAGAS